MQWVVATAAFLASAVEFVEAFTIVLVVGVTVNWRSALLGALAAAATLALLAATLGPHLSSGFRLMCCARSSVRFSSSLV